MVIIVVIMWKIVVALRSCDDNDDDATDTSVISVCVVCVPSGDDSEFLELQIVSINPAQCNLISYM